jgi:ribosomal-protein-alanine N-acetyltransferase
LLRFDGLVRLIGYSLRLCEFRDLDQVAQIEKHAFPERPYSKLDFARSLSTSREGFFVASKENMVVGYVIASRQGSEGLIRSIAVSADSRGKGVGELLMKSAIDYLTGKCVRVHLLVGINNEAAIRLYRKLSFKETGKIVKKYYPNGDDAIEMVRALSK